MPRPPALPAEEKVTIILAVLSGNLTAAEAARTAGVSDQAVCAWKRRFIDAGRGGFEPGADAASRREQMLVDEISQLKSALADSYLQLQSMRSGMRSRPISRHLPSVGPGMRTRGA
ncbi:hypothetical protein JQK87_04580 [Streptomyces sp. G44]|uniref:transposase n=1 Tax=Streptomyces sp. G44 TaxID=2807632 RepID=UPI00195FDB89|nr:transposase [Streptomyces sp. G44]MBM7167693.1 hypothetical protein [Streptomyces sp. G44]